MGLLVETTADFQALDLAWLAGRIDVRPGVRGTLRWFRGSEPTGMLAYAVEPHGLRVNYRGATSEGLLGDITELVPLTATATRFGGERHWLRCPGCLRRCRILYRRGRLRCRNCLGLRYESQYEPAFARAARRALKLRERLGDATGIDDPLPPRPKGMHQRTYRRLSTEIERLSMVWWRGVA